VKGEREKAFKKGKINGKGKCERGIYVTVEKEKKEKKKEKPKYYTFYYYCK
jgi:hypothetical protein